MRFTSFSEYCNLPFSHGEVYGNARGLGHQKPVHALKTKQNPNTPTKKAQEMFAFLDFCRDKRRLQNSGIWRFSVFCSFGIFFLLDSGHGGVDTLFWNINLCDTLGRGEEIFGNQHSLCRFSALKACPVSHLDSELLWQNVCGVRLYFYIDWIYDSMIFLDSISCCCASFFFPEISLCIFPSFLWFPSWHRRCVHCGEALLQ